MVIPNTGKGGQGDPSPAGGAMSGGPIEGDPSGAGEAGAGSSGEPELVAVNIAGRELKVTQEVADSIKDREDEFDRKLSGQGGELGDLRKYKEEHPDTAPSPKPGETPPDGEGVDYTTLFFTNPKEAARQILKEARDTIIPEVASAYNQDKALDSYWNSFYKDNEDLKGFDLVVKSVMKRDWESLKGLHVTDSKKKLADSSRSYLLDIINKDKDKGTTLNKGGNFIEGASGARGGGNKGGETDDKETGTLGGVIRQRKKARIAAAQGK